ncbi:hypothetical protein AB8615_04395 [Litorimonas sp. RW-G-Af-16]|uniref:hypothetical protein n=1 Tax=Litorimonas sp. RW-G-Af-16 TaxID=3241168 RepID=UPI003AAEAA2C
MNENEQSISLGFLQSGKYGHYERERRWLVEKLPKMAPLRVYDITDTYLNQSRMRLRHMQGHGVTDERKLTKKGELTADTRIITTIYLDEAEYALLSTLAGQRIIKRRHYFAGDPEIAVDIFQGTHEGLIMAEVEFPSSKLLKSYKPPHWVGKEITNDAAFSGGKLSRP